MLRKRAAVRRKGAPRKSGIGLSSNCKVGKQKRCLIYFVVCTTDDVTVLHSHQALLCSAIMLRRSATFDPALAADGAEKNMAAGAIATAAGLVR